jgi:hypothetical protein
MPTSDRSEIGQRFPARFDSDAWETDLARSTPTGRQVALAERHDAKQIATLDHRHLGVVRPRHTPSFTLLP